MDLIKYQGVKFTETQLIFDEALSLDDWKVLGKNLKQLEHSVQFYIGDWIRFGERKGYMRKNVSSDIYDEAVEITGYSRKSLQMFKHVAENSSSRLEELPYNHHQEVISMPADKQEELLKKALKEKWNRNRLRLEVKAMKQQSPKPEPVKVMPEKLQPAPKEKISKEEQKIIALIEAGETVVINSNKHKKAMAIALQKGLYVNIGEMTMWQNPFIIDEDGDRDLVCDLYQNMYFPNKPSLHKRVRSLQGKVLGCTCHPLRCHGDSLVDYINSHF